MIKTKCFPDFKHFLGGRRSKNRLQELTEHLGHLRGSGACSIESLFEAVLPAHELDSFNERRRLFCQRNTFWSYVGQMLGDGGAIGSLRDAVRGLQANRTEASKEPISSSTSGYSQARLRLSEALIDKVKARLQSYFEQLAPAVPGLEGRRIRLIDGTTVTAADTPANQAAYPQSNQCKAGCGFPLVRITALFDLSTASVLKTTVTDYHTSELTAAVTGLVSSLDEGDILVGDRFYHSYGLICSVLERKADVLVRVKEQMLKTLIPIKRQPKTDCLVKVKRPQNRNKVYKNNWAYFPKEQTLRLVRFQARNREGKRQTFHLLTTLTDKQKYPASSLAALYLRRWRIETGFGDLKTTLGMDRLRTKTPKMINKDISMFTITYNLIRYLHLRTSKIHTIPLEVLSIKGSIDTILRFAPVVYLNRLNKRKHKRLIDELLQIIASDPIPDRPNRSEPRKRKHRNRGKEWLTKPRKSYKPKNFKPPVFRLTCA